MAGMDFLIAKNPAILDFSLKTRVTLRFLVFQALHSKGWVKKEVRVRFGEWVWVENFCWLSRKDKNFFRKKQKLIWKSIVQTRMPNEALSQAVSGDQFLQKFVAAHEEEAPELLKLHKEKLHLSNGPEVDDKERWELSSAALRISYANQVFVWSNWKLFSFVLARVWVTRRLELLLAISVHSIEWTILRC